MDKIVKNKIEIKNLKRLIDECYKNESGTQILKRKTAHMMEYLLADGYQIMLCNRN